MKLKWLWGGLATAFLIALVWGSVAGALNYNDNDYICRDPSRAGYSSKGSCLSDVEYVATGRGLDAYGIVLTIGVLLTAVVVSLNRPRAVEQQPVRRRAPKKSMASFENRKAS